MSNTTPITFSSLPLNQLVQVLDLDDHFQPNSPIVKTSIPITKEQFIKDHLVEDNEELDGKVTISYEDWIERGECDGPRVILLTIMNNEIHHII